MYTKDEFEEEENLHYGFSLYYEDKEGNMAVSLIIGLFTPKLNLISTTVLVILRFNIIINNLYRELW